MTKDWKSALSIEAPPAAIAAESTEAEPNLIQEGVFAVDQTRKKKKKKEKSKRESQFLKLHKETGKFLQKTLKKLIAKNEISKEKNTKTWRQFKEKAAGIVLAKKRKGYEQEIQFIKKRELKLEALMKKYEWER